MYFHINLQSNTNLLIFLSKDKTSNLYFTNYHNFDIYLKPAFTNKYRAARYFKNILLEQDTQSPHRYTTEEFHPQKDSVILDIGGAEGFSLLIISTL